MNDLDFSKNPSEIAKSAKTRFRDFWMIQNFSGQTAVCIPSYYRADASCQKAKKSLEPFLRKSVH